MDVLVLARLRFVYLVPLWDVSERKTRKPVVLLRSTTDGWLRSDAGNRDQDGANCFGYNHTFAIDLVLPVTPANELKRLRWMAEQIFSIAHHNGVWCNGFQVFLESLGIEAVGDSNELKVSFRE